MAAYVVYNPLWSDSVTYPTGTTVNVTIDGVETALTIGTDAFGSYDEAITQANGKTILAIGDQTTRFVSTVGGDRNILLDGNNGSQIPTPIAYYAGVDSINLDGSATLTIKNISWTDPNNKLGIYAGSRLTGVEGTQTSGTLIVENSDLYTDLRGGGLAGNNATGRQGSAEVIVRNTSVSGYDDNYNNTWPGRIFGAGIAEGTDAKFYVTEATVVCENVTGVTVRLPDGTISYQEGVRIYGGGQAYGGTTYSETGTTNVQVSGSESAISEIYGGGISSGTAKVDVRAQVVVSTSTSLSVTDAMVSDIISGGNNSNMFGYSRVGTEGVTDQQTVITLSLTNVNASTAFVMGGSFADSYYYGHDGYASTAEVFGNIETTINGGSYSVFAGGGIAMFSNDAGTDTKVALPSSTVKGNITSTINGGTFETIVGGGIAISFDDKILADSTVTGNVTTILSNTTVSGSLIAGGDVQGALSTANVAGTATLVLQDGNAIAGDILGGQADISVLQLQTSDEITSAISGFTTVSVESDVLYTGAQLNAGEITGSGTLKISAAALDSKNISVSALDLTLPADFSTPLAFDSFTTQSLNLTVDAGLALGTYTVFNATTFTAPTTLTINGESGFWYGGENKKFELASDAASLTVTVSEVAAPEFLSLSSIVQDAGTYNFQATVNATGAELVYSLSGEGITVDASDPFRFTVDNTVQNTTVTITATDVFGRTAQQTLDLHVTDYTAPVLEEYGIAQQEGTYEFTVTAQGSDNFGITESLYRWASSVEGLSGDGVSTAEKLVLSEADAARTYYFQVMLKDAAGNSTGWSDAQSFTVAQVIAKPTDTVVVAPAIEVVVEPESGKEIALGTAEVSGVVAKEEIPQATYKVLTDNAAKTTIEVDGLEQGEKIKIAIVNEVGKKLKTATVTANKNGVAVINNYLTPSGSTFIQVESLTKKTPVDYTLAVKQEYFEEPSANSSIATAEQIAPAETPTSTEGWVGFGDALDTYKIVTGEHAAALDLNLTSLEANSKVKVTLLNEHGKKIKSLTLTEKNISKKGFSDILLDANSTTFVYVEAADKGKGKYNTSYQISSSQEVFSNATNDSLLDPTKTTLGSTNTGWVGYSDAADYYQFEVAAGSNIGLNLTGLENNYKAGKQVKVTLYNLDTGKKISLKSVKNDDTMNFATNKKNGLEAGSYCAVVSVASEKKYRSDYSLGIASI